MPTDNESKLLAVLEKLFPMGTTLRFLETTEPDHVAENFIASALTTSRIR